MKNATILVYLGLMKIIPIQLESIDYNKPVSFYAKEWGWSHTGLKAKFKRLGIFDKFLYCSGENTGKIKSREIRAEYAANPKKCLQCEKALTFEQKKHRCCSGRCAKQYYDKTHPEEAARRSKEVKKRMAEGTWKKPNPPRTPKIQKITVQCEHCDKDFEIYPIQKGKRRFCSKQCANDGYNAKTGGYRERSGRGKTGWYKGYYCASSWELAWVIYNLDHGLSFSKNKQAFSYIFEHKSYKYYPDYVLPDGTYLEIKGYKTPRWEAKLKYFPHKIHVFYKSEMTHILNYVVKKYGKNFIDLYEENSL